MNDASDAPPLRDDAVVRLRLASSDDFLAWSNGEVTHADFLKEPLERPHPDGLFSERLFGPLNDWCCGCLVNEAKKKPRWWGPEHQGKPCPDCHVTVDSSDSRRHRFAHIELAAPVVHSWYLNNRPSPIALLLDLSFQELRELVYEGTFVVLDPGDTGLSLFAQLDVESYIALRGQGMSFVAETGAPAVRHWLQRLDLPARRAQAEEELTRLRRARKKPLRQKQLARLCELSDGLLQSGTRPEWMVLTRLPVIPPALRPMREMPGKRTRFTSDLNPLYEQILRANERLKKNLTLRIPNIVLRDQARDLQCRVDALFDNARCRPPVLGAGRRPLKSFTDLLQGKEGRFRQNLLGKRVDYSGRGVIVCEPKLKLMQCGLPRILARELFRPHLIGRLARLLYYALATDWNAAVRAAHLEVRQRHQAALRALRGAIPAGKEARAAELLQSFHTLKEAWLEEIVPQHLVLLNRAPSLHRMNIQAFEPVLVSGKAIRLHPLVCEGFGADFDGDTMAVHLPLSRVAQSEAHERLRPTQNLLSPASGRPIVPSNEIVLGVYYLTASANDEPPRHIFGSSTEVELANSLGKVHLHAPIFFRLADGVALLESEGKAVSSLPRQRIVTTVGRVLFHAALPPTLPFHNLPVTRKLLGRLVEECFRRLGREATAALLDAVKELGFRYATQSGLSFILEDLHMPNDKTALIEETRHNVDKVRQAFADGRLSDDDRYAETVKLWQATQQALTKQTIELLKEDQRDGQKYLNPIYLMAHSGARSKWEQVRQLCALRGLMSRPSGPRPIVETPITRNLREGLGVAEYWISTHGARKAGADKDALPDAGYLTRKLVDVAHAVVITEHDCGATSGRRVSLEQARGRTALETKQLLTRDELHERRQAGYDTAVIRTPFACQSSQGLCQLCYGIDLATDQLVALGTPVGVLAAQSIGEPGTQLAMKTKHHGGVVTSQDMVTGLQRIERLLECRRSELAHDRILRDHGIEAVREQLLGACSDVYRSNGVTIDDKHFEVILARMLARWRVDDPADADFLPGELVPWQQLVGTPFGRATPLGITQAALAADSFLSAASFQHTSQVLRDAALAGRVDPLRGLKENVLLGRLIPAGTGFPLQCRHDRSGPDDR